MNAKAEKTEDIRKSDKYIPWLFVLFFAVIAVVDGFFVTMAVRTHTGVVTDRPYERGLAYNETLAAARAQKDMGWRGTIVLDGGDVVFTLKDEQGKPIDNADVAMQMTRPIPAGYDFDVPMHGEGQGRYRASVTFPLIGQWEARAFATWRDQQYQSATMLMVR